MHLRTHPGRAAVAAALAATAAVTLAAAATLPAQAQPDSRAAAPGFLVGEELPPHPASPWYTGEVAKGLPEHGMFCLDGKLPAKGASYRLFGTEYDTGATQIVIESANESAARKLAATAEKAVRDCAPTWVRDNPGGLAGWQDHGTVEAEEGAHVYAVHTAPQDAGLGIHLFGIGRDGRTVTLVEWGQMGTFADAPVAAFKETTATAVDKLH